MVVLIVFGYVRFFSDDDVSSVWNECATSVIAEAGLSRETLCVLPESSGERTAPETSSEKR